MSVEIERRAEDSAALAAAADAEPISGRGTGEDLGAITPADARRTVARGLRVVWRGVRAERGIFTVAVIGSAIYGAGTAGGGWVLGRVTDRVLAPAFAAHHITGRQAWQAGLPLALVALLTAIGVVLRRVAAGVTMYRLQARYRREVTRAYLRLPLAWHHRHPTGQLLSNANADVEASWQVMSPLPMALGVIVMLVVAAVAMVFADPVLAAVGLMVLPAVIWVNTIYQRHMSPQVMQAQRLRAEVSAIAHESFEAAAVVKALGRESAETRRFAAAAAALRDANVGVGRLRGMFDPVMEGLPAVGTLAVLAVGSWRVTRGAADTGDVVQVAYLLTLIAFPVRALGWVLGELPRTVVGYQRVAAVLDQPGSMGYGDAELATTGGPARAVLDRVDHAHLAPDGELLPVLHDVTLDLTPGQTVALVGPTGSGKTTLATLLVRLVDPVDGRVLLDGVDLRRVERGGLARVAALAPQGTFVFDDSVRGNVTLGQAGLTDEDVWAALRLVRAAGFVAALPNGLDTRVGERGTTLSGGQRQRIALARAVIRKPRLLVLDDATSAIDPHVEAEILAGLRHSGEQTTVLVIAYRRATIALADDVVYVENGRVLDRGPHHELLERSPGYRALVTAYDRDRTDEQGHEQGYQHEPGHQPDYEQPHARDEYGAELGGMTEPPPSGPRSAAEPGGEPK